MTYRRTVFGIMTALAFFALSFVSTLGVLASPPAQDGNLLNNPGFEDPFVPFQGDTTRLVADGWSAWHVPQRAGDDGFRNLPPEYQPATAGNPDRVRSGSNAQEYFSFFATHTGGVYQQVRVSPGSSVQFSVYIWVWSSDEENVNSSVSPGRAQVKVGIDPNGGTDGESDQIIWSSPLEFYDEYRPVSVETSALNELITVFVYTTFDQPQAHNNVYLDDASLIIVGPALPSNTPTHMPTPTAINTPTDTPLGFASPTQDVAGATETPSPTATATRDPDIPDEFPTQILHRVVAGDTVGALANRYGSTVDAIIAANGLNSEALIFVEQDLVIPVREGPTATNVPPPTTIPTTQQPTYSATEIGILPTNTPEFGTGGPVAVDIYTVQSGDTLSRIALRYNVTVATLAHMNGIVNPDLIRARQILNVPSSAPPSPVTQPTAVPIPEPAQTRTHIVRSGENAFRISLRYSISVEALARANNISNVNLVYVGQVLTIP